MKPISTVPVPSSNSTTMKRNHGVRQGLSRHVKKQRFSGGGKERTGRKIMYGGGSFFGGEGEGEDEGATPTTVVNDEPDLNTLKPVDTEVTKSEDTTTITKTEDSTITDLTSRISTLENEMKDMYKWFSSAPTKQAPSSLMDLDDSNSDITGPTEPMESYNEETNLLAPASGNIGNNEPTGEIEGDEETEKQTDEYGSYGSTY